MASGGPEGGSSIVGLFILVVLNLYRARLRINSLRNPGSTLRPCLIRTYLQRQLGAKFSRKVSRFTC
jgi:hypothetical protein